MKPGVKITDIPEDVWEVICVQSHGQPIGRDLYNRIQETIKNNPDYFPWEHLYASIPEEVHNAYKTEIDPDWNKPFVWGEIKCEKHEPVSTKILGEDIKPYEKPVDLMAAIQKIYDDDWLERERLFAERKRKEKIWNKHYSKYGLSFRP